MAVNRVLYISIVTDNTDLYYDKPGKICFHPDDVAFRSQFQTETALQHCHSVCTVKKLVCFVDGVLRQMNGTHAHDMQWNALCCASNLRNTAGYQPLNSSASILAHRSRSHNALELSDVMIGKTQRHISVLHY